ncbi:hypothetical protein DRE_04437 [Drechslerella stenobrocha 248]|uniref:Uncharacterized protein n=1 Tax=Drechslerella stenobrocha 248 TaxID=1043628 RepID=W7HQ34_9PEZI|nr:hypothetical protein DRE_04437 [Drechslerella stenobrocha 248]
MARPKKIPSAAAVPRGRITRRSSRPQLNSRTASASAKSPAKPPPEESDNPPQDPSDSSQEEEDQDMDSESDEPPEPVSKASSRAVKKRRTSLGSNIAVVIDVKRTTRQSQHASSSTSVASGASSEFRVFDEPGAVETPATLRSATSTRASSRVALQKTNDEEEDLISDEEEIALSTVIKGKGVSKNLSISTPRRAGLRSSTAPNSVSKSQVRDVSSGKHNTDKPDPQTVSDSELSELSDLSDVSAFDPNSEDCGSGEDEDEDEDEDLPTATDNTGFGRPLNGQQPSTSKCTLPQER